MSQLRNLLGNKVLLHTLGSGRAVGQHRRQIAGAPARRRRILAEINAARDAAMQARSRNRPQEGSTAKPPGLLRRFLNTVRKAFGQ